MTPLNLRRRLRSALTILRGVSPDEAAEVRAVYRTAYDCGDDEPIADLMRQAVGQIDHLRTRVDVLKAQLDAMDQAHADTLSAHYRVVGELDGIRAGLCTDGDTRDALRHVSAVLDDAGVSIPNCDRGQGCTSYHLTHRIHALADERDALRTELATGAATQALDAIAAACGCAEWEYPGQVVRDVEAVVRERDTLRGERDEAEVERGQAVALISTVRAELAAATATLADVTRDRDALIAKVARLTGEKAPKRKRTKEERQRQERERLSEMWTRPDPDTGMGWAIRRELALMGPSTSRDIATRMWARIGATPDEAEIRNDMRWVQDFARAGYLTVAKGPGGVRVYGLKEGA